VEVPAQDIMTADKVTLRMTAVLAYRIGDVLKAVMTADDIVTSVYREVQLALRAVTGTRELDAILADKQSLSGELEKLVVSRLTEFGVAIVSIGIRDIILPGEMKDILNKVMEAKKKAEANLITRREETAALRSQANTAKLLEDNAVLMRLRELEVIEKAVEGANLTFVVGEKGLSQTVTKML
jgi:regulator of protease activity HflC (stomatin/prohibitin superfamily)